MCENERSPGVSLGSSGERVLRIQRNTDLDRFKKEGAFPGSRFVPACLALFLLLASTPLRAGPNEGGFLLVHAALDMNLTTVQRDEDIDLRDCAEVVINVEGNDDAQVVLWVLAAFPSYVSPRVSGVAFGIEFDGGTPFAHGKAQDVDLSLPSLSWPNAYEGVALTFNPPIEDEVIGLYWFATYAYVGTYFAITDHPSQGYPHFVDDEVDAAVDEVDDLGRVGFGVPGDNPCLGDIPQGGCCLLDGTCRITYETVCDIQNGTYLGDDEACSFGSCEGPCCLENECFVTDIPECDQDGGEFMGVGRTCSGLSCLRQETTWGALKHGYRDEF